MKRLASYPLLAFSLIFLFPNWNDLIYAAGPYHGRVIDKETKQPIEGAAVLVVWWERAPGIAHPRISYHDAQETLTDLNGNFTIPGIVGLPTEAQGRIDEPLFYIFKPGYEAYGGWRLTPKLAPAGPDGRHVVQLGTLKTTEERRKNLRETFVPSDVPAEKRSNLIRLRNLEEKDLGLPPRRPQKGAPYD